MGENGEANCSNGEATVLLDYNISSGPFFEFEIEIRDGPRPKINKNT